MPDYPPEPWHMFGDAWLSAWWLPVGRVPGTPDGVDTLVVGRRALVFTAWVRYLPPSPLTYHEMLSAVAVHEGNRVAGSITDIWVDNEASRAGGRQLGGIPKEIATLDLGSGRALPASAATGDTWISTAAYRMCGAGLPWAPPSRSRIVQAFGDTLKHSTVRLRSKPRLATASWNINPVGPLGYLAGHSPFLNLYLADVDMRFRSSS